MRAFIGAATTSGEGSSAAGITVATVEGAHLTPVGTGASDVENPMYLAVSRDTGILYTVHESSDPAVSAWLVEGHELRAWGEPRSTGGSGPCHVSIHPSGRHLLTANYVSGSVSVHPIGDDGSLGERTDLVRHSGSGPDPDRQAGPHAHMAITDPSSEPGRGHVLVTDLGTDTVYRYLFDESSGRLSPADEIGMPAGSGPRHLVVSGQFAYVAGELDSTVTTIDLNSGTVVETVRTRPDDSATSLPSAIRMTPDGRFLYVANRGVDEIAVLTLDGHRPRLIGAVPCGGRHPRDIELHPDGSHLFVANQFSDDITSLRIDPGTRMPVPDGDTLRTSSPACIVFS